MRRLLLVTLLFFACRPSQVQPTDPCRVRGLRRLPQRYTVVPDARTPAGIPVDTSGTDVDLGDIDRRMIAVAACLEMQRPPTCPTVKIAPDAVPSCSGPWLLLPIEAPVEGCYRKGQTPNPSCPCRWRVGIDERGNIIVPRDLYNFGDPLVRMWAHVEDPWQSGKRNETCALAGAHLKPASGVRGFGLAHEGGKLLAPAGSDPDAAVDLFSEPSREDTFPLTSVSP